MSAERINGNFQTAGVLVDTAGESNPKKAVQGYAQMTVSASGSGLTGDASAEGNVVSIDGATIASGTISFDDNGQSVVIDTQGFEAASITAIDVNGTLDIEWSNLPTTGFVAGRVTPIGSSTPQADITADGQYTGASGGRYLRLITTSYTGGPMLVTPTLYAGGGTGGGGGGGVGSDVNLIELAGVAVSTGAGATGTGTLRVAIATGANGVTIADGADVTQGDISDAAWSGTGDATLVALGKATVDALNTPATELPPQPPVASSNTSLTRVTVSISSATTTAIVSATAAQSTRVHRVALTVASGTAQTITFQSAGTSLGAFDIPDTGGSIVFDYSPYWWFKTANNEALNITTSSAAAVKGIIDYVKGA